MILARCHAARMKTPARSLPSLEILESRIAPAGLVDVAYDAATGELTLTGDGLENDVHIFPTGPGTHRIEGINATDIEGVGTAFFDIGKLTKLTIVGGASGDEFTLKNLRTLTALSFSGGDGSDDLFADNLAVKGNVELHANVDLDRVQFTGLATEIGGNVTADSAGGAIDGIAVNFGAQKTVIGGSILLTGGGGGDSLSAFGTGPMSVAKGVQITSGTGDMDVRFSPDGLLKIGKLATGESVLFNGGDGEDKSTIGGGTATLAGGVRFVGGGDDDRLDIFNPAGTVKIGKLSTGESVLFAGGAGIDQFSAISASLSLAGGIDFTGGDGINSIELFGANSAIKIGKLATGESIRFTGGVDNDRIESDVAGLTLAGGIDFTGGDGSNSIDLRRFNASTTIGKLPTGQSILYLGGAGDDLIHTDFASLTLAGGIEMTAGGGANTIDLEGETAKATIGKLPTGHSIKLTGLGGGDEILSDLKNLTLAGGIELAGGNGSNQIELNNNRLVKIGKLPGGQSILFTGGADDDTIDPSSSQMTLAGGIEFNGAGGDNNLFFGGVGALKVGKFGTGQSVKITGTTDADIEGDFGGTSTLAGSLEVTAGSGGTYFQIFGNVTVGKSAAGVSLLLTGGAGGDTVELEDHITLAGSLKLDGGSDEDELIMRGLDSLTVKGTVEFIGGADEDRFELEARSLLLGSTLTFTGGDDADFFSLIADGSIAGSVGVDLGGAASGTQEVFLQSRSGLPAGLVLKSGLTVDATGAAASDDTLTLTNVSVAKLIDLKLGDGISTVNIDNLSAGDEFKLDTRGGADVVNFERGNFFGGSSIRKLAAIQLGLGDDLLAIGSPLPAPIAPFPDHTRVNFIGGLTTDGGGGAGDDRNDFGAQNTFGVPLTPPAGFEFTTLV